MHRPDDPNSSDRHRRGPARIASLDVLRGLAIAGMFIVHFVGDRSAPARGVLDATLIRAVTYLAVGKFYPLFSFLFGCSLALQLGTRPRGRASLLFVLRRFGALALIAAAIWVLTGENSILFNYAACALLALPLIRLPFRRLLLVSLLLLVASGAYRPATEWLRTRRIEAALTRAGQPAGPGAVARAVALEHEAVQRLNPQQNGVAATGRFVDVVRARIVWLGVRLQAPTFWDMADIFAAVLAGVALFPLGVLQSPEAFTPLLRRVFRVALAIGLISTGLLVAETRVWADSVIIGPALALGITGHLSNAALSAVYAVLCLWLLAQPQAGRVVASLRWPGRMALSCFVIHLAVLDWVFSGFGLDLAGRLSPTTALVVSAALFVLLILACRAWLAVAAQGPIEWLWRRLSAGPAGALRHAPPPRPASM